MKIKIKKEVDIEIGKAYAGNDDSVVYFLLEVLPQYYPLYRIVIINHEKNTIEIFPSLSSGKPAIPIKECVEYLLSKGVKL